MHKRRSSRSRSATWMLRACSHGDFYSVQSLLSTYGKVLLRASGSDGCTPLLIAGKRGHQNIVEYLLKKGASIDDIDKDPKRQGNILHYACWGGHLKLAQWLIDSQGADPGCTDVVGNTPLLYAIYGGHRDVVEELLRRGRSLRERNNKNHTAILQASCGGHQHLVEWLLDEGFSLREMDADGNTALLFAAWGGHRDLMEYLLSRGASLEEKNANGHSVFLSAANGGRVQVVEWLLTQGFDLKETNSNQDTALLLAAYGGHVALVERLLELGASLEERNMCGFTPLLSAANGGQLEMADWLLQRGASLKEEDNDGYTSLILAACGGNIDLVQYFLSCGASLSERNKNGDTCLLLAAYCGHTELVEWLLRHGSSLAEVNRTKMGVLISAANGGHLDTVQLIHRYVGTSGLEETDEGGYTPLLLAAQRGHFEVVRYLASQGACLQARTTRHNNTAIDLAIDFPEVQEYLSYVWHMSPLQIATDARDVDRVHEMIAHGIEPNALCKPGETPLEIAQSAGPYSQARPPNEELVALLEAAALPWHPSRAPLFGATFKRCVLYMIWLKKQLDVSPVLPYLPPEVWDLVISFLRRSWFSDPGVHGQSVPLDLSKRPLRLTWREDYLNKMECSEESDIVLVPPPAEHAAPDDDMDQNEEDLRGELSDRDSPVADSRLQTASDNDAQGRVTPLNGEQAYEDLAQFGKAIEQQDTASHNSGVLSVRVTWV